MHLLDFFSQVSFFKKGRCFTIRNLDNSTSLYFPDEKLGFENYSFSKNKESVHIKKSVHIKECAHIKELSIKDSQSIYSAPKKIYKLRSKISSFSNAKKYEGYLNKKNTE